MPGAGRSESAAVRFGGATVALVAIVGHLFFGWSFSGSETTVPTVIGLLVAVSAIGWTLHSRVFSDTDQE
jgi:cobalamin biosynthesis protein CobD/CbiB